MSVERPCIEPHSGPKMWNVLDRMPRVSDAYCRYCDTLHVDVLFHACKSLLSQTALYLLAYISDTYMTQGYMVPRGVPRGYRPPVPCAERDFGCQECRAIDRRVCAR